MSKFSTLFKLIKYTNNNGIPKIIPKYFLGYVIAGITAVLALLSIQAILFNVFNITFFITQIVSTSCGILVSFSINNTFTFKKNGKKILSKKLIQFFITNISSMVLNVFIATFIFNLIQIWYLASITGIFFAVFINYFIYRYKIWY